MTPKLYNFAHLIIIVHNKCNYTILVNNNLLYDLIQFYKFYLNMY